MPEILFSAQQEEIMRFGTPQLVQNQGYGTAQRVLWRETCTGCNEGQPLLGGPRGGQKQVFAPRC
jgi:hypothetical protein